MSDAVNPENNRPRLFSYCVHCGASLAGTHMARKYCSETCKRKYRNVSEGNFPPPEYVGDYDLLPTHIKALFIPGDSAECWISSKRGSNGYAINTTVKMYKANAYRLIYMMMVGPIPEGHDLDHTCDNGPGGCVNWHHLTPSTHRYNVLRSTENIMGKHIRLTHCPQGHPYEGDNLVFEGNGRFRRCKICQREKNKRWRDNNRERARELQRKYDNTPEGKAKRRERNRRYRERKRLARAS